MTRHFSDRQSSGSARMRGLAKYLPEFGWEPTVLTIGPCDGEDLCRVVGTSFQDTTTKWKRRLGLRTEVTLKDQWGLRTVKNRRTTADVVLKAWEEFFSYPDNYVGWYPYAIRAADELVQEEKFDALLSSSNPETSHLIAHAIERRHHLPWVADLRDLWTQNHYFPHWWFRRVRERGLEVRTFSTAHSLTTVSEPLARRLKELHGDRVMSIPNGFDPEDLGPEVTPDQRFSIIYPGILYRGRRDPEPLFKVVRELIDEGIIIKEDLTIEFFGPYDAWLVSDVSSYGLNGVVKIHGPTPREEVLRRERSAQLLLLLMWRHPEEKGVYTGKVFEYLAAQRPILAIDALEDGAVDSLLRSTHAGVNVTDHGGLRDHLRASYMEFKRSGRVAYNGDRSTIEQYSHRAMAQKFAEVLDRATERPGV